MHALARTAVVMSLAAAASAAAAPPGPAVPLPPPPPGTTLSRPAGTLLVGARAGFASPLGNGGQVVPMLQVEGERPWRSASGTALSLALPLRVMLASKAEHGGLESGATALELTPTLRAAVRLGRSRVSLRTEGGLGVVSRWTWEQVDAQFLGRRTERSQSTTAVARMGVALDWAVRPRLSLAFEPLSFGFDLQGNADWILAGGATYRL